MTAWVSRAGGNAERRFVRILVARATKIRTKTASDGRRRGRGGRRVTTSAMSRARISAPFSLRWKPSSARTSLPMPSRGSTTYSAQPPLGLEKRAQVSTNWTSGRVARAARTASSWTARRAGHLGAVVVGDAHPDDGAAVGGEQVHHLAGPPGVLRQPLVLGGDGVVPLHRVRAVGVGQALGVVAAERHDDDVRVDRRQLAAQVRRPVEEVGPGQARRHLVVDRRRGDAGRRRAAPRGTGRTSRRRCRRRRARSPARRPTAAAATVTGVAGTVGARSRRPSATVAARRGRRRWRDRRSAPTGRRRARRRRPPTRRARRPP